jgi:Rod binding domain-containing protein
MHIDSINVPIPATNPMPDPKLKKACIQFEGQFFNMMLKEMRKTVPDDPLLGDDSHQQDIFQGMMDDNVSQEMAEHGGANSLAVEMYNQLAKEQHGQAAVAAGSAAASASEASSLSASAGAAATSDDTPEDSDDDDRK